MAYAPIALTMPQYDRTNLNNHWLKAYEQGTTTPLAMATDITGGTTLAKAELDTQGFPITSGDARFIPFIDGDYDLWLFPTEAEADANDTTDAIQLADNLNADPLSDLVNTETSESIADLKLLEGMANQRIFVLSYYEPNFALANPYDGGGGQFAWDATSTESDNGGTIIKATAITVGRWIRVLDQVINVKWFGAKGDNATDDYAAIQASNDVLPAAGGSLFFPAGTYLINTGVIISDRISVFGEGDASLVKINATSMIGLSVGRGCIVRDLAITASTKASTIGIKLVGQETLLEHVYAHTCDIGIQVTYWSNTLLNCNAISNNTGLSAYAPSSITEINDLTVDGGYYWGNADYAVYIGDERETTSISSAEFYGFTIRIKNIDADQGKIKVVRLGAVSIQGVHLEQGGASNDAAIEVGNSGVSSDSIRAISIEDCYIKNYPIAINIYGDVRSVRINNSYIRSCDYCAIYLQSDITEIDVGDNYYSSISGPNVHTGYRSGTQPAFSNLTILDDGIKSGVQTILSSLANHYYPGAIGFSNADKVTASHSTKRRYKLPVTSITGTVAGSVFTCDTVADALNFNGGDEITITNNTNAKYIQTIDYSTGAISFDYGSTGGAQTLGQVFAVVRHVGYISAVPTTGTWEIADRVYDSIPAPGSIVGWICTTRGTFSAATDSTGETDGSTAVITGLTDTSDFNIYEYVTVSLGMPSAGAAYQILGITASTITLDTNSTSAQTGAVVATVDPVFKTFGTISV